MKLTFILRGNKKNGHLVMVVWNDTGARADKSGYFLLAYFSPLFLLRMWKYQNGIWMSASGSEVYY